MCVSGNERKRVKYNSRKSRKNNEKGDRAEDSGKHWRIKRAENGKVLSI